MPTVFFYGPQLNKEKKSELVRSFTETASQLTGIDKSSIVVYIREALEPNVGVGGQLLEDKYKKE